MPNRKMFACFAFFQNGDVKKWKYVTNLKSFEQFLTKNYPTWKYINVYDKGTKQYLKRFYPGNVIPKIIVLTLLLFTYAMKNTFDKATFNNGFNNTATIRNIHPKPTAYVCQ